MEINQIFMVLTYHGNNLTRPRNTSTIHQSVRIEHLRHFPVCGWCSLFALGWKTSRSVALRGAAGRELSGTGCLGVPLPGALAVALGSLSWALGELTSLIPASLSLWEQPLLLWCAVARGCPAVTLCKW